ncbi:voltage-dependent T-type calcium channel subunit alpha-1I-like protein [Labeo rohita]|uniref:Voltage-dependent T-type calcium channel subunit alpha-1I-like protein n=1 Tax=Labeo rohita TaxID=84645 RepID=A0A498P3P9_LABRO|nr:voltage-dependent T-type calcium channel subunit alpha-1I-like protein [Labeo rohita]
MSSCSTPKNRFRLLCQSIIAHKLFDYVVLAFIFSNCITVALERPKILQGSLERLFLTVSNYIFTAIFVGEMTLKSNLQVISHSHQQFP